MEKCMAEWSALPDDLSAAGSADWADAAADSDDDDTAMPTDTDEAGVQAQLQQMLHSLSGAGGAEPTAGLDIDPKAMQDVLKSLQSRGPQDFARRRPGVPPPPVGVDKPGSSGSDTASEGSGTTSPRTPLQQVESYVEWSDDDFGTAYDNRLREELASGQGLVFRDDVAIVNLMESVGAEGGTPGAASTLLQSMGHSVL